MGRRNEYKYKIPTQERLKQLLTYTPETGEFTWNNTGSGRRYKEAGSIKHDGYARITIDYIEYSSHHLAWLYMTGEFPQIDIDHIDRNKANNRWENLRLATKSQNQANWLNDRGITGYRGIQRSGRKWQAKIKVNGITICLGSFEDPTHAEQVYLEAREKYFGEFNHPELKIKVE